VKRHIRMIAFITVWMIGVVALAVWVSTGVPQ
jgi:hypothetical protein